MSSTGLPFGSPFFLHFLRGARSFRARRGNPRSRGSASSNGAPQNAITASPMYLSSVPLWRKTICVISVRYSLSSAASSCASSFSEMLVNPRTSLNITVISVLRGFTRSGFSSSRRITSGLRYCWNAPRTRRFSFSSTSARYIATNPTLATSVPEGMMKFSHHPCRNANHTPNPNGTSSSRPNSIDRGCASASHNPSGTPNRKISEQIQRPPDSPRAAGNAGSECCRSRWRESRRLDS